MNAFLALTLLLAALQVSSALPTKDFLPITNKDGTQAFRVREGPIRPENESGKFEGDIMLTEEQMRMLQSKEGRTGIINTSNRWSGGVIPYTINAGQFTQTQLNQIYASMNSIQENTCIRFVTRTNQVDYIRVTGNNDGCWSWIGRIGGAQDLNLYPNGCIWFDTIIHEFMHAIGFFHMQSATERDNYVAIMWQNIISGMESQFESHPASMISQFGYPYDLTSVMHYGPYSFSSNGQPTMVSLSGEAIDNQGTWNTWDAGRINNMYQCQ